MNSDIKHSICKKLIKSIFYKINSFFPKLAYFSEKVGIVCVPHSRNYKPHQ